MKKQQDAKPVMNITRCPTCGAAAIERVCEMWTYATPQGKQTTPRIPHWRCNACGERLFDKSSHDLLDPWRHSRAARPRRRKPSRVSATTRARRKS